MTNELQAAGSDAATYVAKITIKSMGCDPRKVASIEGNKLPLARVYGKISEVKYIDDKNNGTIHSAFVGIFEGVNLENGEVYRSGKMFLPKGISEMMEQSLRAIKETDESASIKFAFELRSVKASNPIGYSYEAQALVKTEREDELTAIRQLVLAAPATGAVAPHKTLDSGKSRK